MHNCFLMPSRLKSHIILVLDRLQCVARVNGLVLIIRAAKKTKKVHNRTDPRNSQMEACCLNFANVNDTQNTSRNLVMYVVRNNSVMV